MCKKKFTKKDECHYKFCMLGKLGHGDTNRVYRPKVMEAFVGMYIRKVACGSQSSLALTSTGQVRRISEDYSQLIHLRYLNSIIY